MISRFLPLIVFVPTLATAEPITPVTTTGVTAHRGYSGAFVENTMQAFEEALKLDVDWIETDIRITSDGQIVLTHDGHTLALTGEDGSISDMTYAEIAELDTAVDYRQRTGMDETRMPPKQMPLLRDALELIMTQDRVRLSLQPKDDSTAAAIEMIQEMGAEAWVGFNDASLEKMSLVKELAPEIPVFWDRWSVSNVDEDIDVALDRSFESLVYNQQVITPEAVDTVHAAGLEFGVWTVNDSREMREFIEMGVDRLYSDHAYQALLLMGHDDRDGLQRGLVSYWPFDENANGIAANPGSPNPRREAVLESGAEISQNGIAGGALALNGGSAHAVVPYEVVTDGTPAFTISAWIRPETIEGSQAIVYSYGNEENTGGESITLALSGGNIGYGIATRGEHVSATTEGAPVTAGQWHHVALTYEERTGRTRLFVDGMLQEVAFSNFYGTERTTGQLDDTDGLFIGASNPEASIDNWFDGSIDELAVWTRALSDDEVATLSNDGSAGTITALNAQ